MRGCARRHVKYITWAMGVLVVLALIGFIVQVSTDADNWVSAFINVLAALAIPACGYQGVRGHSRGFMWTFLTCASICNIVCAAIAVVTNFMLVAQGVGGALGVGIYYIMYGIVTVVASVVAVTFGCKLLHENPQYFDGFPTTPNGAYYTPSPSVVQAQPPAHFVVGAPPPGYAYAPGSAPGTYPFYSAGAHPPVYSSAYPAAGGAAGAPPGVFMPYAGPPPSSSVPGSSSAPVPAREDRL